MGILLCGSDCRVPNRAPGVIEGLVKRVDTAVLWGDGIVERCRDVEVLNLTNLTQAEYIIMEDGT